MTKLDAAAEAIRAAGYDQMAEDFLNFPHWRNKVITVVVQDVKARMGYDTAERLERALRIAAR